MPLYNPDLGLISCIRKRSTQDGPGIRDTVFLKGCPLGCLWCSNPELIRPLPDVMYAAEKCVRCGTCVDVCSQHALSLGPDGAVIINRTRCDGCGDCVDACRQGALELVGHLVGVDEVVTELLNDHVSYQASGGGVTFSGGEPLWQSGFVVQVARKLKGEGVPIALDTSGDVTWCRFEEVLDSVDLVRFEIKTVDSRLHRQWTGRENDLLLANARLLAAHGMPMHIRLVVVPGLNDTPEEIHARMELVRELETVEQVEILPYRHHGVRKYTRLGLDDPLQGVKNLSNARIKEIQSLACAYGYLTTIGE